MNIKESFLQCKKKPVIKDFKTYKERHNKKVKTFQQQDRDKQNNTTNQWKQQRLKIIKEDFSVFFKSSEFLAQIYRKYEIQNDKNLFQQVFKFVLIKFLNKKSDLFTNKYQLELLEEYMKDEYKKEFVDKLNKLFIDKSSRFKGNNNSMILIGPSGIGKKTLVQSYCNSNDIILQKCDFSLYRNLKQFVQCYGNTNKFQNLFFDYREKEITKSDEKKKKDKIQDQLSYSGSKQKIINNSQKNKRSSIRSLKRNKKGQVSLFNYFTKSGENENQKRLSEFINRSKSKKSKIKDYFNNHMDPLQKDVDMLQRIKLKKVFMCYNFDFLEEKPEFEITKQLKKIKEFVNQSQFPYIFVLGSQCQQIFKLLKNQSSIVHMKKSSIQQNYYLLLSILIIEKNMQNLKSDNLQNIKEIEEKIIDMNSFQMPNKLFLDIITKDIEINWNCFLNLSQFYLDEFFQDTCKSNLLYREICIQFKQNRKMFEQPNYLQQIQYTLNKVDLTQVKQQKNIQQQTLLNFFGKNQVNKENKYNHIQKRMLKQNCTQKLIFEPQKNKTETSYILIKENKSQIYQNSKKIDEIEEKIELQHIKDILDDNQQTYFDDIEAVEQTENLQMLIQQRNKEFFPLRLFSFEYDYFSQLIHPKFTEEYQFINETKCQKTKLKC